jgi:tRNA threonylcarbamoyladenosine biosynthesis protein TsaE
MSDSLTVTTSSPIETKAFASRFSQSLHGGECIALHGDLGAGKTRFVRGLVMGLGGDVQSVSSPTYVLLNVYDSGRLTVYHLDAYRTSGADDMDAIGFSELLEQGGVVVVEWAERIVELLPKDTIHIRIRSTGESTREIRVEEPRRHEGTKKT